MVTYAFDKIKNQLRTMAKPLHSGKRTNKIAVCLAGGGITGAMYEIGCLAALEDFLQDSCGVNEFDIFVGTSAGAIVSAIVANGYTPREIFEGIGEESGSSLNFRRKDIYNLKWSEVFKSLAPLFLKLPKLMLYGWKNRKQASFMDLLAILQEFIPPGIFSLKNLDKFMTCLFYPEGKTNDFRNLKKELYIPATELDTGKRWVFGEEDTNTVPISKAVAASAAIPIFFRPFRINGHDFIDGSTSQVSHMDVALKHGAKLIIIINPTMPFENDPSKICLPTFDGQCGRLKEKGIGLINDQARRIETKCRFDLGFARFKKEHPDVDFIIIQPKRSDPMLFLHGLMEFDSRKLILNHGYNTTLNELVQNQSCYQEIFEKHKLKAKPDFLATQKSLDVKPAAL
ncbi:MAG: patatin-like phospholipase family protein [bacterium]